MNVDANFPRVRISPPAGPLPPGRGFYQLEEEALYVQIGMFGHTRPYFSTLESPSVQLELDREGSLQFIGVNLRRKLWQVDSSLVSLAEGARMADVRWLDFRTPIPEPVFFTNTVRTSLTLRFGPNTPVERYRIAEAVVIGIDASNCCRSIHIERIEDDLAGQEIAAFRRNMTVGLLFESAPLPS